MHPRLIAIINALPPSAWQWVMRTRSDGHLVLSIVETDPWQHQDRVLTQWESDTLPDAMTLLGTLRHALGSVASPLVIQ